MNRIWNLSAFADRTALLDEAGESMTYGQLQAEGDELAKAVGGRCLAFILCRNSIGSVLGYTAFLNHGIVPVMVNSHLEETLLSNLLEAYAPEYLWLPADQESQFPGMEKARKLAEKDIYKAMCYCTRLSARHLKSKGQTIHPRSQALLDNYDAQ